MRYRPVTILDCKTTEVETDDLLYHRLVKSVEQTEQDRRWLAVNDQTPVKFGGGWTVWGDLMLQDRKTVEMGEDGILRGGYPL